MSEEKINEAGVAQAPAKKEETALEQAKRLEKEVEEYKKKIEEINDMDALKEEEKVIIAEIDKFGEYIKTRVYSVPDEVIWEGKRYSRADVAGKINYFINKNEVGWQYTLGLYQLCQFWKNTTNKEVTYGQLDSTLRILENQKFRGYEEWRDILMVNEYMKALHEDYTKDLAMQIAGSQKHNAILERMDLIGKVTTDAGHEAE